MAVDKPLVVLAATSVIGPLSPEPLFLFASFFLLLLPCCLCFCLPQVDSRHLPTPSLPKAGAQPFSILSTLPLPLKALDARP